MMKKALYVTLAALVCSAMATGAMAQWSDDFEGYSQGVLGVVSGGLYAPEANALVTAGSGYLGTQGVVKNPGAAEHLQFHAYRPAGGNISSLTGRAYAGTTMGNDSHALFGALAGTSYNAGDAWMGGNGVDYVHAHAYYGWGMDQVAIQTVNHFDDDDPGTTGDTNCYVINVPKQQADTWYDLRICLDWDAGVARGYYRISGDAEWLLMEGEGTFYDENWASTPLGIISEVPLPLLNEQPGVYNDLPWVGLAGRRDMALDDIEVFVPEPGTLVSMLALGVPALAFMRRRH
jgi:hypothetical protein